MPRKYFRKYLPTLESVKGNRFLSVFGKTLHHHNLWHLHRRSVAGGVAVGLFSGLIPGPFQMLVAAILAAILRVNLPVALLATLYTNPFTIVPLYLAAYKLGTLVTGGGNRALPLEPLEFGHVPFKEWIPALVDWTASLGKPLLIGLPMLAVLLAGLGYFAVLGSWRLYYSIQWRRRRARFARSVPRHPS
ncbi:DUF2062 domain-containing protein [Pelomicrobium sp. G1]|uniref:DUF2062 domain-containing protein n=1 Tax=unclassified Pelomicrobium TaxID=2815318 RepID=UPI003F7710BD